MLYTLVFRCIKQTKATLDTQQYNEHDMTMQQQQRVIAFHEHYCRPASVGLQQLIVARTVVQNFASCETPGLTS